MNNDKSIKIYWHKEHDVPYAYKPGLWIGFDNIESLVNKANYLKNMGLGGVIVWSLDMDDKTGKVCNQGPYPVLNTLRKELTIPLTTTPKSTKEKVSAFPRGFFSKKSHFYRLSSSASLTCINNVTSFFVNSIFVIIINYVNLSF